MEYYITKKLSASFDEAVQRVKEELGKEGFGVLTEIDVQQTLKKKLNVDFPKYRILGACNPTEAFQALQADDKVGTMLPCNVIIQERPGGQVEISAINPDVSMQGSGNPVLDEVAKRVTKMLNTVVQSCE